MFEVTFVAETPALVNLHPWSFYIFHIAAVFSLHVNVVRKVTLITISFKLRYHLDISKGAVFVLARVKLDLKSSPRKHEYPHVQVSSKSSDEKLVEERLGGNSGVEE